MEQPPLVSLPVSTVPAVLLGSGPGPAPTLDIAVPMPAYPPRPREGRAPQLYTAILDPMDLATGLRGWMLAIHDTRIPYSYDTAPKHHFSRAGARPPLPAARLAALQTLGYEPAADDALWRWQETVTLDGKQVVLFAALDVVQLAGHREAAL